MGPGFIRRFRRVGLLRSAVITPLRCAQILPNAGFNVHRRGRYSATVFASRLAPVVPDWAQGIRHFRPPGLLTRSFSRYCRLWCQEYDARYDGRKGGWWAMMKRVMKEIWKTVKVTVVWRGGLTGSGKASSTSRILGADGLVLKEDKNVMITKFYITHSTHPHRPTARKLRASQHCQYLGMHPRYDLDLPSTLHRNWRWRWHHLGAHRSRYDHLLKLCLGTHNVGEQSCFVGVSLFLISRLTGSHHVHVRSGAMCINTSCLILTSRPYPFIPELFVPQDRSLTCP